MINNLFSIFDPSSYYISIGWILITIPTITLTTSINSTITNNTQLVNTIENNINNEINTLINNNENNLTSDTINSIFYTTIVVNTIAILPINFTPTAHISITIYISLTIWTATILNAIANSINSIIIHLTPMGTPTLLINFMVIIEIISIIIRPITLAIRLSANIVAGHLLISLLSSLSISSNTMLMVSWAPIVTLITLEIAVAVIQAYVITVLIGLYYKETF